MQASFSDLEYAAKKKVTRRDRFLGEIDKVTPWSALVAEIEPFYPKGTGRGRPPIGVERMLRMYIAQQCFGLSDEGIEDAIYDSQAIRGFVGIDLNRESAPDATTLLKFRHLLEQHKLTEQIFAAINALLAVKGLILKEGTVVDATIIAAPSSTKNQSGERDPEMHQTKKGNQWHFGMKAHIGVDADTGITHTLVTTPANTNDVTQAHALLHGEERIAFGDAGYQGVEKREENQGTQVQWEVALRPGKRKALPDTPLGRINEQIEKLKASVRAKVEHPFHIVKNLFGMKKARYKGLAKNTAQLFTLFGLANLLIAKRRLFALNAQGVF
jgi:IS5 family transposase